MWRDKGWRESRDEERADMERVGMWESRDVGESRCEESRKVQSREVVEAVVEWFAWHWLQIAVELLCQGDVWVLETTRNPVFSRIKRLPVLKRLPVSMEGTSFVRRVRLLLRLAPESSPLSALHGGDLWNIQCAVPLCLVVQA